MKPLWFAAPIAATLFAATACKPKPPAQPAGPPPCQTETFEGSSFTVCTARRADSDVRIYDTDDQGRPLRSFAALQTFLGKDATRVRFAMNAGMFDNDGRPIGLFIKGGQVVKPLNRQDGPGNFHMMPNGVFSVEGDGFHVRPTEKFLPSAVAASLYATQSGPMLVIDGKLHPKFSANGTSLYIRNAVGVDAAGNAIFVMAEDPVSFGRLARFYRDVKKCPNALFFDGSVSSLWWPGGDRMDAASPLGPLVVSLSAAR